MEKTKVIVGLAVLFGGLLYMGKDMLKSVMIDGKDALNNGNVRAFLAMIRQFESAGDYQVVYGGQRFASFADHPNIRVPFLNPRTGKQDISTAAGAYQITNPTWQTILKNAGKGDFSPASQDAAAVWLLKINGSLAAIMAGDFQQAIKLSSKTWASLPYTDSKQAHVTLAKAQAAYTNNGGAIA